RDMVERLAAAGVLSKETHETVIRFAPPLTIRKAMIDDAVDRFRAVVKARCLELGLPFGESAPAAAARPAVPAPTFLMSPPDHFEVSYAINPWMNPKEWSLDARRLRKEAMGGWEFLRAT